MSALLVRETFEPRSRSSFCIHLLERVVIFFWLARVCSIVCDILGERSDRVLRGKERDSSEVWSLMKFHVSLWALVSNFCVLICQGTSLLVGVPSSSGTFIEDVWLALVFFHLYLMKVVFIKKILLSQFLWLVLIFFVLGFG